MRIPRQQGLGVEEDALLYLGSISLASPSTSL